MMILQIQYVFIIIFITDIKFYKVSSSKKIIYIFQNKKLSLLTNMRYFIQQCRKASTFPLTENHLHKQESSPSHNTGLPTPVYRMGRPEQVREASSWLSMQTSGCCPVLLVERTQMLTSLKVVQQIIYFHVHTACEVSNFM